MLWKPLVLEWLEEARKQAEVFANRPNGTRYKLNALEKARSSIDQLNEINDLTDLKGIPRVGEKTLEILKKKWENYLNRNPNIEKPLSFQPQHELTITNQRDGQLYPFAPPPAEKKTSKVRNYIPRYGSVAYFVLITMREYESTSTIKQGIGQSELKRLMKVHTSGVLEGAAGKSTLSLGMAIKTLTDHHLIYKLNNRLFLEPDGKDMANKLMRAGGREVKTPEKVVAKRQSDNQNLEIEEWDPTEFKVMLVLDTREVASRQDRSGLQNDLRNKGLEIEVMPLSLGDCLWVAEHNVSKRRAVLDWIVERKTLADLRSSIHDGRFQEQKQRLYKSNIGNAVYLVEIANSASNAAMFKDNRQKLLTAMSQTLVTENFRLKITRSQNETVTYLYHLTNLLAEKYSKEKLTVVVPIVTDFEESMKEAREKVKGNLAIDFSAFHEGLTKSKLRTVGATFQLMLRAIKGVSREKAMSIQRYFPTPKSLMRAYENANSEEEKSRLVMNATSNCIRRQQVNAALSDSIYRVWGNFPIKRNSE